MKENKTENLDEELIDQENKTENLDEELIDQENKKENLDEESIDQENKTKINLLKENINETSEIELINQNEEPIKMTSKINVVFDKEDKLNTFSQPTLKNQLFNDFFKNSKKLAKSLFDLQLKWLAFVFFIVFLELFIKLTLISSFSVASDIHASLMDLVSVAVVYPMIFIFFIFNSVSIIQMREENSIKRYFTSGISRIQILFIDVFLISIYALVVELFMLFVAIPLLSVIVNASFDFWDTSFVFDFSQIDWLIFLPSIIFGNIFFAVLSFIMGTKINSNKTVQFLGSFIFIYVIVVTGFGTRLVDYSPKKGELGGGFFIVLFKYLPYINPITIVTEIVSLSGNIFYRSAANGGKEIYYTIFSLTIAFSIISVVLSAIYSEKLVNLSLGR